MSDAPRGPGWWRATDGRYYPPEEHPSYQAPPPPPREAAPYGPPPQRPPQMAYPPAGPRRKSKAPLWIALGAVLGVFLLFGFCAAVISNIDTGEKVDTGQAGDTGTTAEGAAQGDGYVVGDKVALRDGSTVQVLQFVAPVTSTNQFIEPKAGRVYAAIEVEGCAGRQAQQFGVNPFEFALVMPDNSRQTVAFAPGTKEPELHSGAQAAGTCNRGWINYEVPENSKPSAVLYSALGTAVQWKLP